MKAHQLKNAILQLAVQGKLVPQNPNDEPASKLLERIAAEKQKRIKAGEIKKDKRDSTIVRRGSSFFEIANGAERCIDDELPFDLPKGWEWCRLNQIMRLINGRAYKQNELFRKGKYKILRVGNLFTKNEWYYSDMELEEDKYVNYGDLIFAWSASFGPFIWQGDKCIYHYHIWKIDYNRELCREFLYFFLMAQTTAIKAGGHGLSMQHVTKEGMEQLLIPIPPLAEQRRIVDRLESLLPLVEAYGKAEAELSELDARFPDMLKKSILQDAVQGKLVPQNPHDEPASKLLERIAAEKRRRIKAGEIKKDKRDSTIVRRGASFYEIANGAERCIDDELPFDLPKGWEWARLGAIGDWGSGATPSRTHPEYYNGDIPWLKTGDLTDSFIESIPECISQLALKKTSVRLNETGSVLMAMYGATIGKLGILTFPATTNQACCACKPLPGVEALYLFYFLMSQRAAFIKRGEGGAQPNISKEKIVSTLIPIPPLAEQRRIVDRIESLFSTLSIR